MAGPASIRLLVQLFAHGAIVIEDLPYLRTVIQPDGDVLCAVHESFFDCPAATRQDLLDRHTARMQRLVTRISWFRAVVEQIHYLSIVPVATLLVTNATAPTLAIFLENVLREALYYALPTAIPGAARLLGRRAIRWYVRRRLRDLRGSTGSDRPLWRLRARLRGR